MKSETEMASHVVTWLQSQKMEVYQEVKMPTGSIADIVANCGGRGWIIECKRSMGIAVMTQAWLWRYYGARMVSVAVLSNGRKWKEQAFVESILRDKGIGMITVDVYGNVNQKLGPSITKYSRSSRIRDPLDFCIENHKSECKAGSQGGYWTPFKSTVRELEEIVRNTPGIPMSEAFQRVTHHYKKDSTAKTCLSKYLREGVIPSIRIEKDGRVCRLFIAQAAE